jgi:hypothetical protein
MKKLNKTEVEALANKLYLELNPVVKPIDNFKEVKKIMDSKEFKEFNKLCKFFKNKYNYNLGVLNEYSAKSMYNNIANPINPPKFISKQEIKDNIILAQIEAKDLSSLVYSVKKQFNK